MKCLAVATALVLALAPAPAAAQTSVWLGFGIARPYASGVVVVGPRYPYYYRPYYRPPVVVVEPGYRRYFYYRYGASRVGGRRGYWGYHRRWHHDFDEHDRD